MRLLRIEKRELTVDEVANKDWPALDVVVEFFAVMVLRGTACQ
jgi:hypothetical protein